MGSIISWLYPEPELTWYEQMYGLAPDPDPRSDGMILSKWNPFIAAFLYLGGLFYVLPRVMEKWGDQIDEESLRLVLRKYNLVFVSMNALYGAWVLILVILAQYSWICAPSDPTKNEFIENQLVYASWLFLVLKLTELADSFLLKLGNRHGVVLFQAYHHTTVYFYAWMGAKYVPTGNTNFYSMINAFTHVALYTLFKNTEYSLMSLVYTTSCTQFSIIFLHALTNIYIMDCGYPLFASWMILLYMLSFFTMYTFTYVYNRLYPSNDD